MDRWTTRISFRPACTDDFDYCASLYFSGMAKIIEELNLDLPTQVANFRQQWELTQVRMIALDGEDTGWLQTIRQGDALFLVQLFVDAGFQRRGIGTLVMHRLIDEARREHRAVTLHVVQSNPALRLYERLGFRIVGKDDRKFHMRRDLDADA